MLYPSLVALALAGVASTVSPDAAAPPRVLAGAVPPGAPNSFADLVARVAPAVVSVEITARVPLSDLAEGADTPFSPRATPAPDAPTAKAQALCSGFFITSTGYLVTNNHCVRDETALKVTLKDGRELAARLVGADEPTDLAVIKVEGQNFPFINFADKARPRVGDWAIAIGNPYGLSGTATAGIVSANAREIGANFNDFIQIDTPINRGNSGGPTFDTAGRVIGVNTIIVSESGGAAGIGFAIPADTVERVSRQLIAQGHVSRGYLGATVQNLTPDLAKGFGLPDRKGAVVAELAPGGPASKVGLEAGDVLVSFDGEPLTSSTDLTRHVAQTVPGQVFSLALYRDGRPMQVKVTAALRPSDQQIAANDDASAGGAAGLAHAGPNAPVLGMTLGALDDQSRRRYGVDAPGGVVVEAVQPDSEAADKGLKQGMVVFRAGDRAVRAASDVREAMAEARRQGREDLLLGLRVDGRNAFLALKLTRPDKQG